MPLLQDLHMNEDMFAQHLKEHLLKAKQIFVHVVGPSKKIEFEDRIAPLDLATIVCNHGWDILTKTT
jgi:hypothetical protein